MNDVAKAGARVDGRTKLRYRWSHRHPVHRALVRAANRFLGAIPFGVKYWLSDAVRKQQLPYRLLTTGSVAIQVGAPLDTLRAGRSRGMTFARRTRPNGRVLIIEPDPASASKFERMAQRHMMAHVDVVCVAGWFEHTNLTLSIDATHPATNFTSGSADYAKDELTRFNESVVPAAPLDDLISQFGIEHVDLVSITTNGAEKEVIRGLCNTIERDRPYICLARTRESYTESMREIGYVLAGNDDRGFTFRFGSE